MNASSRTASSQVARPTITLAGPTASGKSAAALALASALRARGMRIEIVSVDSALVYRGMDIGTAKPTAAERAAVPHHGIDLIDPAQRYSAARFVDDARRAVAQIQSRGALPLLVGGTMLYLKALRDGLDAMPPAEPRVRAALDARAAAEGWPALHAELARVDPETAARLPPTDAQRIQRALEVWMISGRPLSAWHTRPDRGRDRHGAPHLPDFPGLTTSDDRPPSGLALSVIALEPVSRSWLHERIAQRFDAMLEAGLVDEVRRLRARGDLHPDLPSMRCVGYRQVWEALDAVEPSGHGRKTLPLEADPAALRALREAGTAATRQLAKRQLTWLRGMADRFTVEADAPDATARVIRRVMELTE